MREMKAPLLPLLLLGCLSLCSAVNVVASGGSGWALSFDGANDHVQISQPAACGATSRSFTELSAAFTIEAWFTWPGLINDYQYIAGQGGDHGFRIQRMGLTNSLALVTSSFTGACREIAFAGDFTDGAWHHAAATYNGTSGLVSFYRDGVLDSTKDCSAAGAPGKFDTVFQVGQDHKNPGSRNGYGLIDEVRLWTAARTAAEIAGAYNRALTTTEIALNTLLFYLPFDEGDGVTTADVTGHFDVAVLAGGGLGKPKVIGGRPTWVPSAAPASGSNKVVAAKFGGATVPVSIMTLVDTAGNVAAQTVNIAIVSITGLGSFTVGGNTVAAGQQVDPSTLTFVPPGSSSAVSGSASLVYTLVGETSSTGQHTVEVQIGQNQIPYAGDAGTAVTFDGKNDFLYSESVKFLIGEPATVEWWGLTTQVDFERDKLEASGASLWSIGNQEVVGNWCPDDLGDGNFRYCGGRFQVHAPWTDGMLSWDYGWAPGTQGRVSADMRMYFDRWTHYAVVSDGSPGGRNEIYLDGELFAGYNGPSGVNTSALPVDQCLESTPPADIGPSDGIYKDMDGLWIGGWPFWGLYHRGAVDEFRVWRTMRSAEQIRNNMRQFDGDETNMVAYYSFNEDDSYRDAAGAIDGSLDLSASGGHTLYYAACSAPSLHGGRTSSNVPCLTSASSKLAEADPSLIDSGAPCGGRARAQVFLASATSFTITLNGTDPDTADTLTATVTVLPSQGELRLSDGTTIATTTSIASTQFTLTYVPNVGTVTTLLEDSFYYTVSDNNGATSSAVKVPVTIRPCAAGLVQNANGTCSCPAGYQTGSTPDTCVKCAPGSFKPGLDGICGFCAVGTFQPASGSTDCTLCPAGKYQSEPGSSDCIPCQTGLYQGTPGSASCVACPIGIDCVADTSVATFNLTGGYWRVAATSEKLYKCESSGGNSPCLGGANGGDGNMSCMDLDGNGACLGSGYCKFPHHGPKCEECMKVGDTRYYYDSDGYTCRECPSAGVPIIIMLCVVIGVAILGLVIQIILYSPPAWLKEVATVTKIFFGVLRDIGPSKLKSAFTFYQIITSFPTSFELEPININYRRVLDMFSFINFDWSEMAYPTGCLVSGYSTRLVIVGFMPVGLMIVLPAAYGAVASLYAVMTGKTADGDFLPKSSVRESGRAKSLSMEDVSDTKRRVLKILALGVFVIFVFLPSICRTIFSAWACVPYEYDTAANKDIEYMRVDGSILCDSSDHDSIIGVAIVMLILWPGILQFMLYFNLIKNRVHLRTGVKTVYTASTEFLTNGYKPHYFYWEMIELFRRIMCGGFVVLIPREYISIRILVVFLISQPILVATAFLQPFKNEEDNWLSLISQSILIFAYLCCGIIYILHLNDIPVEQKKTMMGFTDTEGIFLLFGIFCVFFLFLLLGTYCYKINELFMLRMRKTSVGAAKGSSFAILFGAVFSSLIALTAASALFGIIGGIVGGAIFFPLGGAIGAFFYHGLLSKGSSSSGKSSNTSSVST